MNHPPSPRLVLSTAANVEEAEQLARAFVERRLAACVNVSAPMRSIYRWQGVVQEESEVLLIIKTTSDKLVELEDVLRVMHSYDVPEFLVLPIEGGAVKYLAWLAAQVAEPVAPAGEK